jgi:glycosyltransferase involved in cell wall biosynthesis
MLSKTLVIVPAYNEEKSLPDVISDLKNSGFPNILVIDDGSTDNTKKIALDLKLNVISHPINVGLGGAIASGLDFAREFGYATALTFDADGQHLAKDALSVLKRLEEGNCDIVIGSRLKSLRDRYALRYLVNFLSNIFTFIISGIYVSDSQSGLRAFGENALNKMHPATSGYEVSSEIIMLARQQKLKIQEVPINAVYSKYSLSKGQKIANGLYILRKLLFMQQESIAQNKKMVFFKRV